MLYCVIFRNKCTLKWFLLFLSSLPPKHYLLIYLHLSCLGVLTILVSLSSCMFLHIPFPTFLLSSLVHYSYLFLGISFRWLVIFSALSPLLPTSHTRTSMFLGDILIHSHFCYYIYFILVYKPIPNTMK